MITSLQGHEGEVTDQKEMLTIATGFYKTLFGYEAKPNIHLKSSFWNDEEKLSKEENTMLSSPLSEEEIRTAIFDSYADGAPGPDGFPFLFYQRFWDLIKNDFMALVKDFEEGRLDINRLNYVMLILIPKEAYATEMRKFRPIALINCSFKIFSKALNNRLIKIIDMLISPNQTAFIQGRYILESVVAAHEIIHEVARGKKSGIVLKIDYEKAYDRVNWDFLIEVLSSRGFSNTWISWITKLTQGGSVCVRLNDVNGPYFAVGKGLRQGDPLSPLPFNLVVDVFTRMLSKAATQGLIGGLLTDVIERGIVSL